MSGETIRSIDLTIGTVLLQTLHGLTKAGADADELERLKDVLLAQFDVFLELGGAEVELAVTENEARIGGVPMELDVATYGLVADLGATLKELSITGVTLTRKLRRGQVDAFVAGFLESTAAGARRFEPTAHPDVVVAGGSAGGGEWVPTEVDEIVVDVYRALLDATDGLLRAHDAGEDAPLVPVKRVLVQLIDAMRSHGAVVQLLTTLRDRTRPLDRGRLRAAVAIDAVGFGLYIRLPPADLMTLAVSALLAGTAEEGRPFFRAGLGASAMAITLCVEDARSARSGGEAGVPGRMLAAAETYQDLIAGEGVRLIPADALEEMTSGDIPGLDAELAGLFVASKGDQPLGSVMKMPDGKSAMVVSQGVDEDGRAAPIVARYTVEGGLADEQLDVGTMPGLQFDTIPVDPKLDLWNLSG